MSNDTAKTITTNIVPVQGTFEPLPPYECIDLIGPAGTPFFAPTNPNLDGVNITNSTINSTTIGVTTPALGAFTTASATNQPLGNNDLTTKLYVDSLALGISWKQPVLAATLSNITLSGEQTIDTVAVVAGDRVLVKNQTNQAENGIYIAATGAWSRSPDANDWDELVSALVFIESGTQAGSAWYCPVQAGGTLGVTAITWNNFSVGGVYFAGTGLNLSGGDTFNISNTTVAAASYGSASAVPTFTVNAQGQLTAASNTNIAIAATQITSGTIDSARLSGSYSGITGVGTLTDLTVSNTITGSISGNAATATTATSATSATTATNLAGGAAGSVPYQSGAGATTFLAAGTNGQVLTIAGGVPSYATPTTGTVTSVSGTGTVSGISLSGTVTSSGSLTLGGTLDLSAPPTIGNTTPNTGRFTTLTVDDNSTFGTSNTDTVTFTARINSEFTPATDNTYDLGRTGHEWRDLFIDGTANIDSLIADTADINAGTIDNTSIGATTAAAAKVTTLDISSTLALAGSTGTNGYVLTSNGASAPTWEANANGLAIVDDTTTNATRYLTFTSATSGNITTENVSSTKLAFNPSTGNLGLGTSTPSADYFTQARLLQITGPLSAAIKFERTDATARKWEIGLTGGGNFDITDTVASTSEPRFRINTSGQVGIGTSSPAVPLDVVCDSGASGITQRGRSSDNVGTMRWSSNDGATAYGQIQGRSTDFRINAFANIPLIFYTNDTERMRITDAGNIGVGTTSPGVYRLYLSGDNSTTGVGVAYNDTGTSGRTYAMRSDAGSFITTDVTASAERMRITSDGDLLVGKTSTSSSVAGTRIVPEGTIVISRNDELLFCNRLTTDGGLVVFQQDGSTEGSISVSGSTVSYNGGHLSRWSQLPDGYKDDTILKGTVMSNLDDMCVWEKDGVVAANEQLNKMQVSSVEGDTNVAGVFVNWTVDTNYGVDDMNVAMTGDMIIRIAEGVVVQKGDLLMSAGDGTAKPQGDDIVRSKTVAKVTSNHVTCTYADGSYCVPCVLMAC
jgi:hypothetical protein